MGRRKDRGCLNCKRNSITITLWKHSSFNENQHIWRYKISHMGLPKDRGVVNCKINSITITFLNHACFNENEQIWGYKLCHMGQRRDRGSLNCKRNSMKIKAWSWPNFNARARKNLLYLSFLNVREARPHSSGRPGRARARARALSRNQNFKITTFLLVNFKNDHGKSCSVSRDWQPPQSSAQSVPISQTYDQKPDFFKF